MISPTAARAAIKPMKASRWTPEPVEGVSAPGVEVRAVAAEAAADFVCGDWKMLEAVPFTAAVAVSRWARKLLVAVSSEATASGYLPSLASGMKAFLMRFP